MQKSWKSGKYGEHIIELPSGFCTSIGIFLGVAMMGSPIEENCPMGDPNSLDRTQASQILDGIIAWAMFFLFPILLFPALLDIN